MSLGVNLENSTFYRSFKIMNFLKSWRSKDNSTWTDFVNSRKRTWNLKNSKESYHNIHQKNRAEEFFLFFTWTQKGIKRNVVFALFIYVKCIIVFVKIPFSCKLMSSPNSFKFVQLVSNVFPNFFKIYEKLNVSGQIDVNLSGRSFPFITFPLNSNLKSFCISHWQTDQSSQIDPNQWISGKAIEGGDECSLVSFYVDSTYHMWSQFSIQMLIN